MIIRQKLLLTIAGILMISGCRIGNHYEAPALDDPYSGYYVTRPKSLTLHITLTTDTISQSAPTGLIPKELSKVITNPVAFVVLDKDSGSSMIVAPGSKSGIQIRLHPDHETLSLVGTTPKSQFWKDPACQTYLDLTETGKLIRTADVVPPKNTNFRISGKLELHFQIVSQFDGDCRDTFEQLARCYQNSADCGGNDVRENAETQLAVIETFQPWIDAGLITPSDIAFVNNYAYEVSYE